MSNVETRINRLWAEYAPRIAEAEAEDGSKRHRHFLDLHEETIGPFRAVPLTIERWIILNETGALVAGDTPTQGDLLRFLWIVSPDFSPNRWKGKWFMWRNRRIRFDETLRHCHNYLEDQFEYLGNKSSSEKSAGGSKSSGSSEWVSGIIDLLASEYGWTPREILKLPLSTVLLYTVRIKARHDGKRPIFSSEADALKQQFMNEANRMRRKN